MPKLSVWSIRAALVYLGLGFTFGGLLLANKGVPISPLLWALLPAHVEFLLLGWTVQLALGVAFWILPRFGDGSRGDERPAWAAFLLLNLGVLLVALQPWLRFGRALSVAGRALEALAAVVFVLYVWGRIRPTETGVKRKPEG